MQKHMIVKTYFSEKDDAGTITHYPCWIPGEKDLTLEDALKKSFELTQQYPGNEYIVMAYYPIPKTLQEINQQLLMNSLRIFL